MDKHCTTNTANVRNRAHEKPPWRQRIIHLYRPWQWPPHRCDKCGGTKEVKNVTKCKQLCKRCRVKRNRAHGG